MTQDDRSADAGATEQAGADAPAALQSDEPIYTPQPGELQLTVRAVAAGCLLGALVSAMNVYLALTIGWGIGGSLIAAILAYAFFAMIRPRTAFTPLETNIAQTAGSAAGSMTFTAGLVTCIPAIAILHRENQIGPDLGYLELTIWAASVAWIGVFYAVPLRRQMILVEKLKFPTGTATAHTILAMFGSGAETMRKARALVAWALIAAAFTLAGFFVEPLSNPPFDQWTDWSFFVVPAAYSYSLLLSPMLIGAGILVGMRVSLSLVAGGLVGWAILAPLITSWGWVDGPPMSAGSGARGWILWPGVAIMVADAMTNLALSWRSIVGTFRRQADNGGALEDPRQAIPNSWWMGGLALATVFTSLTLYYFFDIQIWMTVLAILLSSVLAAIATRSTGETDINPISGVGKVTQLVYGGLAPGQTVTNLMTAGVTGAGAAQAADMMQDLKTGHLLGASPRKQFIAQLIGIGAGVLVCVPIYFLVTGADLVGEGRLPAPGARAWGAVALVLSQGLHTMPRHAGWAALLGLLIGVAIPLLARSSPRLKRVLPSGLAFGIGFIVFGSQSLCFLYGAIAFAIWKRGSPAAAAALGLAVASGLIAGEGLMGVITAGLKMLGVESLVGMPG